MINMLYDIIFQNLLCSSIVTCDHVTVTDSSHITLTLSSEMKNNKIENKGNKNERENENK